MNKNYVKPMAFINKNDLQHIGGKGKSIYILNKNNIKIPKSFYILDTAFEVMIRDTNIDKDIVTIQDICKDNLLELNTISNIIVKKILNYKIPLDMKNEIFHNLKKLKTKYLVVRSSAFTEDSKTSSWAGILESYLYTNENNIFHNILKCWSSLFKIKSLVYFKMNNNNVSELSMSIIIQEMINSNLAGVCFTIDPVFNEKKILINYCNGLCKNIVEGSDISKQYIFEKDSYKLLNGNPTSIEFNTICNLLDYFNKIEKIFQFPQDIEWCLKGKQLYILQSRPITTIQGS